MSLIKAINDVNKAIEKAKPLTTKQRKKLKKGTFCGPNRSFPVNDCTRVRAAKVYLNRSKFSKSTKQRIAACINRKAKALGCPGTKPAKAKGVIEVVSTADQKVMDSSIFKTTKELVELSIENEGMTLDFSNCVDCI